MKTILIVLLVILGLFAVYFSVSVIIEIRKRRDMDSIFVDKVVDNIMGYWDKAPSPKPGKEDEELPATDICSGEEDELLSAPEPVNWEDIDFGIDERFDEVARFVVSEQTAIRPVLQKRLALGYHRAGSILGQLEEAGIVGPENGEGERLVLVKDSEELEQILSECASFPRAHSKDLEKTDLHEMYWEEMTADEE